MKPRKRIGFGWLGLLVFCHAIFLACCCSAQTKTLDWFKVSGGGDLSAGFGSGGAQFTISGTIGQPDAGQSMTGNDFSIVGGFWSFLSPPAATASLPQLTVTLTATNSVIVSWPTDRS